MSIDEMVQRNELLPAVMKRMGFNLYVGPSEKSGFAAFQIRHSVNASGVFRKEHVETEDKSKEVVRQLYTAIMYALEGAAAEVRKAVNEVEHGNGQ